MSEHGIFIAWCVAAALFAAALVVVVVALALDRSENPLGELKPAKGARPHEDHSQFK